MNEQWRIPAVLSLTVCVLSACSASNEPSTVHSSKPAEETRAVAKVPEPQAADAEGDAAEPSSSAPATGVLALRDALSLALVHNPRLAAFSWEVRAREAAVLQAGVFPNPVVTVEVENFGGSGVARDFDASESTLWLSQLIELGGKRIKRRELAQSVRSLAGWDYEAARIDTFTDVALAYVGTLAAQERAAIARELVEAAEEALRTVAEQVRAGAVSAVETSRAEVAAATARVELARRLGALESAKKRLAATWGATKVTFSEVAGTLDANIAPLPTERALLRQVKENPDLARWTAELSVQRAALAVEESKAIPDVTLSGGPRWLNETDDNAFVFELNVPLPLFDRNQGAALEARHRLAKASEERRAAEIAVITELSEAYRSLASTHDAAVALRAEVLPKAEKAFDGAMSAYRRGVFRFLDVLDAQRTLFALRSDYLESLAAYHAAVARVERLVGRSLEEIRDENKNS